MWLRGCTGKKQHATGELAMQHALATQTRYGIRRVYQCKHCNQWHLTSHPDPSESIQLVAKPPTKKQTEKLLRNMKRSIERHQAQMAIKVYLEDDTDGQQE